MRTILDDTAISELGKLVGQRFQQLSGPFLWEHLSASKVLVTFEEAKLAIFAKVLELDFEGFDDEYSQISIESQNPDEYAQAVSKGYLYYRFSKERVQNVYLVREHLTELKYGHETWTLITDISIQFELETGMIAVTKQTHHDELLLVSYSARQRFKEIPVTSGRFEPDLIHQYQSKIETYRISPRGVLEQVECD